MVELTTTSCVSLTLDVYNKLMADQRRLLAIIELHDERCEPCPTLGCWIPRELVGIDISQDLAQLEKDMGKSLPSPASVGESMADQHLRDALWAASCGNWYGWAVHIHKWKRALQASGGTVE